MKSIYLQKGKLESLPIESTKIIKGDIFLILDIYNKNNFISRKLILNAGPNSVLMGKNLFDLKHSKLLIFARNDSVLSTDHNGLQDKMLITLNQVKSNIKSEINQLDKYIDLNNNEIPELIDCLTDLTINWKNNSKNKKRNFDIFAENDLFIEFDKRTNVELPSNSNNQIELIDNQYLASILELIASRFDIEIYTPKKKLSNTNAYLKEIINLSGLVYRDIILNEEDLNSDCGDLVGFTSENPSSLIYLYFKNNKYYVFYPEKSNEEFILGSTKNIINDISQSFISIYPSLNNIHITPKNIFNFAFGSSKPNSLFILVGLSLGSILGFVFAIGQDVGAFRWVISLSICGLGIGYLLGILNGLIRTSVLLAIIGTFLAMLIPTFNTIITNQAIPNQDFGLLLQIAGILLVSGILRVALEWTQAKSLLKVQQKGSVKTQLALLDKLLKMPIEFYRKYTVGDLKLRFLAIGELRNEIQDLLEGGVLEIAMSSLYLLFMFRISVKLTVLAFLLSLAIILPTVIIGLQTKKLERKKEEVLALSTSRNLELISSVSKLRLSSSEYAGANWWSSIFQKSIQFESSIDSKIALTALFQSVIPNLGILCTFILLAALNRESFNSNFNSPNSGEIIGFLSALTIYLLSISNLSKLIVEAFDIPILYERVEPIFKSETESEENRIYPLNLTGRITFDRVSYRYNEKLPLVIDNISISINPGEFVAVVGPSGSGKSTLAKLLLGLAEPEEGVISFDSQPLNGLKLSAVRKQIGTVMQDSALFTSTVFENISGGRIISLEQAWEVAEKVGLANEIRSMPMGMQTLISESGGALSGGQIQRIAIARALVSKPKIVIFDEATSSLDDKSQEEVTNTLDSLNITRIVIAHRLTTIKNADKIIVLDKGQVLQFGEIDKLSLDKEGLFYKLMNTQKE